MRHRRRSILSLCLVVGVGANEVPEQINLFIADHALPWRHLALAVVHRILKARSLVNASPTERVFQMARLLSRVLVFPVRIGDPDETARQIEEALSA